MAKIKPQGTEKIKLKGVNAIYAHYDHLDIDVELDKVPFSIRRGEAFYCMIKQQTLGFKPDGMAHFVVAKFDSEKVAEPKKQVIKKEDKK